MNFNSMYGGYGIMGAPSMMGMYGNPMMGNSGNVVESLNMKYACADCYSHGPRFVEYNMPVNPLPEKAVKPSFFTRLRQHLFG